ncbi:OLC1v1023198C1 [Oldenlandia corymbosa var. corymbosa]|uniref:OLC1v1023198C1 n=1 Tax=Oldenlandia corymbosa var. corymbosa TaxID=529605 RepID=A0AAV1BZF4_OLDCO|nr:OLC1v1023198C1 [Oldenlandia corymbosa var. corymbosa]
MPPKRKGRRSHPSPRKAEPTSDEAVDGKLPKTLIISQILARLPVKSIVRFKCVCKTWRTLFSSPQFIAMHFRKTSENPANHSLIIHSMDEEFYHNMSVLNVNSTEKEPVCVVNPFPVVLYQMDLVGSVNGMVCLACPPAGNTIVLWNPAMNLWKEIQLSKMRLSVSGEQPGEYSIGFGYDEATDDYKIVLRSCAEVYSVKKNSWKRVKLNFQFKVSQTKTEVIAKGIPCWTGFIADGSNKNNFTEVLLWFDLKNDVFKHVSMPKFAGDSLAEAKFVEWKETPKGTLFLYEPVTNGIKEHSVSGAQKASFEAFSYIESLVHIEGMELVKEQDRDKYCFKDISIFNCFKDVTIIDSQGIHYIIDLTIPETS